MHLHGLSVYRIHLSTYNNNSLSKCSMVYKHSGIMGYYCSDPDRCYTIKWGCLYLFFSVEYLILIKCDYTGRDTYGCTGPSSVGPNNEDVIPHFICSSLMGRMGVGLGFACLFIWCNASATNPTPDCDTTKCENWMNLADQTDRQKMASDKARKWGRDFVCGALCSFSVFFHLCAPTIKPERRKGSQGGWKESAWD